MRKNPEKNAGAGARADTWSPPAPPPNVCSLPRARAAAGRHALTLAALAVAAGCADLDDRSFVHDLRLLASAAEPPEIFIADFDDPGDIPSVPVTALVADPAGGGRPVSARLTACPYFVDTITSATGGSAVLCDPFPPELKREFPVTDDISADGLQHTLAATVSFDDATRAVFARAPATDRIYGMAVFTEWQVSAGDESTTAVKRLRFTQPQPDWGQTPNRNPVIDDVAFYVAVSPATGRPAGPIDYDRARGQPVPMPLEGKVVVDPVPAADAVETNYVTPVATSASDPTPVLTVIERERVRFSFYATAGRFQPATTSTELGPLRERDRPPVTWSTYVAPGPGAPRPTGDVAVIWIVARDERGGSAWIRREIQLNP